MKIGAPRHPFLCHEPTADVVVGAEVPTARSKSFRDHPDQHLRLVAGREQLHLADMPWESMGNILGNACNFSQTANWDGLYNFIYMFIASFSLFSKSVFCWVNPTCLYVFDG